MNSWRTNIDVAGRTLDMNPINHSPMFIYRPPSAYPMRNPESINCQHAFSMADDDDLPIGIIWPVMELFLAVATKASAQSSSSVCRRLTRRYASAATFFAYLFLQSCLILQRLDPIRRGASPLGSTSATCHFSGKT